MRKAFTLAEVLVTLGIIGVVAAITMPVLINKYKDMQFKIAYKKVYSELNQALTEAIFNQELTRSHNSDSLATEEEWSMVKSKFKIMKACEKHNAFDCWTDADRVCTAGCSPGGSGVPSNLPKAFIDAEGRSWVQFNSNSNIFLVDTNGQKAPNKFGKDRWVFKIGDKSGQSVDKAEEYAKVIPYYAQDIKVKNAWCTYPPCYYYSWLFE